MSNNTNSNDYNEREGRVLELYDQGKSTREIAKELRMSLKLSINTIEVILPSCLSKKSRRHW
jgi:DNA-binding NarL/FixJ family response regulator